MLNCKEIIIYYRLVFVFCFFYIFVPQVSSISSVILQPIFNKDLQTDRF